jgi:hypothetical protein
MPVNVMLIRALLQYYLYYGDNFKVECPTGSGNLMNLFEVSREISTRLQRIFLRDEHGKRPSVRDHALKWMFRNKPCRNFSLDHPNGTNF